MQEIGNKQAHKHKEASIEEIIWHIILVKEMQQ